MMEENRKSILVVNSEPDIADLFAEMLLMDINPYIVTTALTGNECLSSIKKNRPDLVLTDIQLSDMGGWLLIKRIKKENPDIPVVVITSKKPRLSDMKKLSMVSDYLITPVTLDCLHMAVRDAIEIPLLLDHYIYASCGRKEKNKNSDLIFFLLKQTIIDRKRFILMRQLYPDRRVRNDHESRTKLETLKGRIKAAQTEIRCFKNNGFLLA